MHSRDLSKERSFAKQNPTKSCRSGYWQRPTLDDGHPLVPELPHGFVEISVDSAGKVAVIQRWQKERLPAVT